MLPKVPSGLPDYELTEEEKQAAIIDAQAKKKAKVQYDLERQSEWQWEQVMAELPWKPSQLLTFATWKLATEQFHFDIDAENHAAVKALSLYFSGSEKFASAGKGFSLKKGLMICGDVGRGKTTLMKLFRCNPHKTYTLINCRSVADEFAVSGESVLMRYTNPIKTIPQPATFLQSEIGICFDDFGVEELKKSYGNTVNVLGEIIMNRYDSGLPHNFTHITTNHTAEEIEAKYSERVRSRMREMFNMIVLGGPDRRC